MQRRHVAALGAVALAIGWFLLRSPDRADVAPGASAEPAPRAPVDPPATSAASPAHAIAQALDAGDDAWIAIDADERAYLEMRALVNLRDISGARAAAERFYVAYPQSPWGVRVHALTGVRPPPHLGPD